MRRLLAISLLVALLLPLIGRPDSVDAASCRFVLGFKQIHDAIPDVVGDCLDNETYDRNGAVQDTTGGLMVWRRADNFTAFTDGYHTWLSGPYGLSERLNTERFTWENDLSNVPKPANPPPIPNLNPPHPATASGCSFGKADVSFHDFKIASNGVASAQGTVRNRCPSLVDLTIDVFAREGKDGLTVTIARTIVVRDLPAGQSRAIEARLSGVRAGDTFDWQVTMVVADLWCFDSSRAWLNVDPWLSSALLALTSLDEGRQLVAVAAEAGVRVVRGFTDYGVLASYAPYRQTITINHALDASSSWVRATALAHELQHVVDFRVRRQMAAADCYYDEEQAFLREARVWSALWQGRLPADVDSTYAGINEMAFTASSDLDALRSVIANRYQDQCER